ncbi:MAG: YifB family Mg chelatase-like AAA ATPase [Saccharofermentanales bacterium]
MNSIRYSKIYSCTLYGISGVKVEIEVSLLLGLASFEIVGLGDSAIRESRDRVHAAIKNSGFEFPGGKITVSMAPAFIRKAGSAYDLPVAIGILAASRQIGEIPKNVCIAGEISLNGDVRRIPGAINRIITAESEGFEKMILPADNLNEGSGIDGIRLYGVQNMRECIELLENRSEWRTPDNGKIPYKKTEIRSRDIATIAGQPMALRALQIAAAGRHNMLMIGSPGCGKTSIASVLPGILPALEHTEKIEVARIYSSCGLLKQDQPIPDVRPFRAPHHSATIAAISGGGLYPSPGEMTLAHTGVLFMDEINEFRAEVLDMLRQPMEEQKIRISRNKYTLEYPADFMLVGAANPCKCGNLLERDMKSPCKCSSQSIDKYFSSISGPLMDRIDIYVELFRVSNELLGSSIQETGASDSPAIREKVIAAWDRQFKRCRRHGVPPVLNSRLPPGLISRVFELGGNFEDFTSKAVEKLNLSVRGYQKIIRVARTIADYEGCAQISASHFAQALQFRRK